MPSRPTRDKASATRLLLSAFGMRARSSGRRTFASTRAHGIRVGSWNTKASDRPLDPTRSNAPDHHRIRPSEGSIRLAMSLSSVLLPQPEGPMSVRNSPAAMVRSIGASARVPLGNTLSADRISTTGAPSGPRPPGSSGNVLLGASTTRPASRYIASLRVFTNLSVNPCFQSTSGLSRPAATMKS